MPDGELTITTLSGVKRYIDVDVLLARLISCALLDEVIDALLDHKQGITKPDRAAFAILDAVESAVLQEARDGS